MGRFPSAGDRSHGMRFLEALDCQADKVCERRVSRSLFHEDGAY